MKLSVITVNLNNAEGLSKTMNSVCVQIFKEFEYIVVDGASTDGSLDVIEQFNNSTIKRLQWISEKDTGVFNAMNKAIRIAKGDYLLFLNSGDFLVNENVLATVFKNEYVEDFLCGECLVTDKGKVVYTTNPPETHTFSTYFKTTIAHQATFIRQQLFKKYGYYREDFKLMSDREFWIRTIILNNCTTRKLDVVIADYNLDGISSNVGNTQLAQKEIKEMFSHPLLNKFVPDYDYWYKERDEMKIMYWVKSKNILYKSLELLFSIASIFNNGKHK